MAAIRAVYIVPRYKQTPLIQFQCTVQARSKIISKNQVYDAKTMSWTVGLFPRSLRRKQNLKQLSVIDRLVEIDRGYADWPVRKPSDALASDFCLE
eukprot:g60326.t1